MHVRLLFIKSKQLGIDKHSWFIDPQITFSDMIQKRHHRKNIKVTASK